MCYVYGGFARKEEVGMAAKELRELMSCWRCEVRGMPSDICEKEMSRRMSTATSSANITLVGWIFSQPDCSDSIN